VQISHASPQQLLSLGWGDEHPESWPHQHTHTHTHTHTLHARTHARLHAHTQGQEPVWRGRSPPVMRVTGRDAQAILEQLNGNSKRQPASVDGVENQHAAWLQDAVHLCPTREMCVTRKIGYATSRAHCRRSVKCSMTSLHMTPSKEASGKGSAYADPTT
jgi:hypothetical protein